MAERIGHRVNVQFEIWAPGDVAVDRELVQEILDDMVRHTDLLNEDDDISAELLNFSLPDAS